ncbi:cytochrome c family protein [Labrys sp. KNU-23]|uniref:c-type cytochrome n=1 Tax=Labrys sp. KNU-23 TaxID=2789216 RepID=UPI00165A4898|nr:cytochrome c family protein [Labrys sp. KNU-23]
MNRTVWFGLAAALGGVAVGTFIALRSAGEIAPPPPPAQGVADIRPPEATFNPVFEPCAHCHQIGRGARSATGPILQAIEGRKAGTLPGYPFSPAMQASGLTWDAATLDRFIAAPQAVVPGTRMIYAGMDDIERRRTLVEFILKAGSGS